MKFFVIFLVLSILPALCFGILCNVCDPPDDKGCNKRTLQDCNKDGNTASFWCHTKTSANSIAMNCIEHSQANSLYPNETLPSCFKGGNEELICICTSQTCAEEIKTEVENAGTNINLRDLMTQLQSQLGPLKPGSNSGNLDQLKPPTGEGESHDSGKGTTKSLSFASWIVTGFLSFVYLMQ